MCMHVVHVHACSGGSGTQSGVFSKQVKAEFEQHLDCVHSFQSPEHISGSRSAEHSHGILVCGSFMPTQSGRHWAYQACFW